MANLSRPTPGVLVASAGSYKVYEVAYADRPWPYELVGPDGVAIPPAFKRLEDAMAAMTALLARPIAGDQGCAAAPPLLPDA